MQKFLAFVAFIVLLGSCQPKEDELFDSDISLFESFIESHSSGYISSTGDIRIALRFEPVGWKKDQELESSLFQIEPKVKGKVKVLNTHTLAFVPDAKLPQDTEFNIRFQLGALTQTDKEQREFRFRIRTIKQDFTVHTQELQSYSRDWNYLKAYLQSSDHMDWEIATSLVEATQNGKKLKIKWNKNESSERYFAFTIDSIERLIDDHTIDIRYDGSKHNLAQKGQIPFIVPGKNNFSVISAEVTDAHNQQLSINFSDPIKKGQDLRGLIAIGDESPSKFTLNGNVLRVFFDQSLKGKKRLEVFQGIESEDGFKMKKNHSQWLTFDQTKPEVRFKKSGTLLPTANDFKIHIEVANLKAVDVKIYRIFQNNILQFLQDNDINGGYSLRKVSLPIAQQRLDFDISRFKNPNQFQPIALDLRKMIQPEPGAIYRVELSYKKAYSLYHCESSDESTPEVSYFDEENDEYYYNDYDWRQRDNPCHNTYYYERKVASNILVTDIGVVVKRDDVNNFSFFVTNILTAQPISGAKVQLYNYQQQILQEGSTNAEGNSQLHAVKDAYFAVISHQQQRTYVKLEEGASLSLSSFDVAGQKLQQGLKGFVYGERGVWRPGDTLHIGFMLNDAQNKIDASHPIKLRLNDPNGKLMHQEIQKYRKDQHYVFKIPTQASDPTGTWETIIHVGGAKFFKNIKIETIKPNRLKINYPNTPEIISSGTEVSIQAQINWLNGAVGKQLKFQVNAKFSAQKTQFKGYEKFHFDDLTRSFDTDESEIYTGKTDENGGARFTIPSKIAENAPGMVKGALLSKVYENGGDFSSDVMTLTFSPYATYAGLRTPDPNKYGVLETDKKHHFEIATLDEKGKPRAHQPVEIHFYKLEWRWWWDATDSYLANFNSQRGVILQKTIASKTQANGKVMVPFGATDQEWGRYLVRVEHPESGHATSQIVFFDWPYTAGKTRSGEGSQANLLVFSSDAKKYNVGQNARITFPSSEGGRALVSLETGSKILKTFWVNTQKNETEISIPITTEMAPGVYVYVSLLQPYAQTKNDLPIRMYGVIPLEVINKSTVLEPVIKMPDVLKPEQKTSISVSEKNGKSMTYTIAVVDDGLLDLTRFKTPNAWPNFYSKEALGVKTWDIYDDIIGAYGGKVRQLLSVGGDEDMGGAKAKKASRFTPVVIYLGPFTLEKGKTNQHAIQLPNYVGSVRTMVVAGDITTQAYGAAEKTTPVRSPLMLLASGPRKISPAETITLPVTVFAMEKNIKTVDIQIQTLKGIRVEGSTTQRITFDQPEEKMAFFSLKAGDVIGNSGVKITAVSGNERATYLLHWEIVNPNPITRESKSFVIEAQKSMELPLDGAGMQDASFTTELSYFPSMDFEKRLNYLIEYPHGCLEQTTSAVFPQLYLSDVMSLSTEQKKQTQLNIKAGIQKIHNMQLANGGLSYWSGNQAKPDDWSTTYAGHFMLEAERKGYVLPAQFKQKWLEYQSKTAKQWRFEQNGSELAQAYRLYTLALAKQPDVSAMNRLRETKGMNADAKFRLAAAYALIGQKQAGTQLINGLAFDGNQNYYFGSLERNRALAIETYFLLGEKSKAYAELKKLSAAFASSTWMSTQTTAIGLNVFAQVVGQAKPSTWSVDWVQDGRLEVLKSTQSMLLKTIDLKGQKPKIQLKNNSENPLFVQLTQRGVLPMGQEKVIQQKLQAQVVLKNKNGQVYGGHSFEQGSEWIAEITLKNASAERVDQVALTYILPSGFEILNFRYTDFGEQTNAGVDYSDIRDDRMMYYFSLKSGETKTFKVLVQASYLGKYYAPGLQAEAMYDATFIARNAGKWIEVVK